MDIAITDNCAADRMALKKKLDKIENVLPFPIKITEFENGEAFLAAASAHAFDLVFLDIYMDGIDGIETAGQLHDICPRCLTVFVTISSGHALAGFRVRAFHYLVKPFSSEEITSVLREAASQLGGEAEILVRDGNIPVRLPLSAICYAVCEGHYLLLYTTKGVIRWRQPFAQFCETLEPYPQFFVCNRGTLVNLEHVARLTEGNYCFLMNDGSKLSVRQKSRSEARSLYFDFLFRTIRRK